MTSFEFGACLHRWATAPFQSRVHHESLRGRADIVKRIASDQRQRGPADMPQLDPLIRIDDVCRFDRVVKLPVPGICPMARRKVPESSPSTTIADNSIDGISNRPIGWAPAGMTALTKAASHLGGALTSLSSHSKTF